MVYFPFVGNATHSSCSCLGKYVVAADPAIQHANTPNVLLVLEIIDRVFSSHRPHAVPNRIVSTIRSETSTTTRHRDANTTAAHWGRRVRAICRRSARGHDSCSGNDGTTIQRDRTTSRWVPQLELWTRTSRCTSRTRLGLPNPYSYPSHARRADTTRRWCASCQGWITDRSRHHRCQAEALSKNSTCRISTVFCTVCTVGTRLCTRNRNVHHSVDELELGHLQILVRHGGQKELVADDHRDVQNQEIQPPPPPQPHLKSSAPHPPPP